jgi:hypothetical protein
MDEGDLIPAVLAVCMHSWDLGRDRRVGVR